MWQGLNFTWTAHIYFSHWMTRGKKWSCRIKSSSVSFSSSISHYCVWRKDIPTFSFTDETITHIRTLMTTRALSRASTKPFLNRNLITKNSLCLCRRQVRVEWFTELKREYINKYSFSLENDSHYSIHQLSVHFHCQNSTHQNWKNRMMSPFQTAVVPFPEQGLQLGWG